jgi:hypothetical protein
MCYAVIAPKAVRIEAGDNLTAALLPAIFAAPYINVLDAVVPALEASVGQLIKSLSYVTKTDPGEANSAPEVGSFVLHIFLKVPKVVRRIVFARRHKVKKIKQIFFES